MIKAEVPWLQRNDLTRLDYDARYAAKILFNWISQIFHPPCVKWLPKQKENMGSIQAQTQAHAILLPHDKRSCHA